MPSAVGNPAPEMLSRIQSMMTDQTAALDGKLSRAMLLTDLRNFPIGEAARVFLMGKTAAGDGWGGTYYWDSASMATEDGTNLTVIASNKSQTGRWIRTGSRVESVPQGKIFTNGRVRVLYASGTTNSSGEITINLTRENTSGGTALFSEIWFEQSVPKAIASAAAALICSPKTRAANLKTTTHVYTKANAITLLINLSYNPFIAAGSGIDVQFMVMGSAADG